MTGHTLSAHFFLAFLRIFSLFEHKVERFMAARESLDQVSPAPGAAQDDIWVTSPDSDLAAGFTLPPGGVADERIGPPGSGRRWRLPRPDYITAGGRDLRLDLIRGFMVFAMIADHVAGDSPLALLTGGNRFLTSAAEGFVFISGLMTGLVYGRVFQRGGVVAGLRKILARVAALYALTVTLTLLFSVFSERTGMPWARQIDLGNPVAFVFSIFALQRTYFLVDVPLLYMLLFLCAPAALALLQRGKGWLMLAISLSVYALYQVFPDQMVFPWPIEGNGLFNFSAWQLIFFMGLWLGYQQPRVHALGARASRFVLIASGAALAALVGVFAWLQLGTVQPLSDLSPDAAALQNARLWVQGVLLEKADAQPGRLVATTVVLIFFLFLTTRFWTVIKRVAGPVLLPLGQHALYAYAAFVVIIGPFALVVPPLDPSIRNGPWLTTVLKILAVALIVLLVKLRFLMPTRATRRLWFTAPVVAGLLVFGLLSQQAAVINASLAKAREAYASIAQMVAADLRPGDRVWLDGADYAEAYAIHDPDPTRVFSLPALPASDAEADATLALAAAGASRIHVLYYGERAADPASSYERWLAGHAFKAREQWVGDIRFATYALRDGLPRVTAGAAWRAGISLSSAAADLSDVGAGDIIPMALVWTASNTSATNYSIFVHLGPADGPPVAQNDAAPAGGFRPIASWRRGEAISDKRGVMIPSATPSGRYTLFVGLYDPVTGERLKLVSGADRFGLGQVTVR